MDQNRLIRLRNLVSVATGRRDEIRSSLSEARSSVRLLSDAIDDLDQVAIVLRSLVDAEITDGVKALESLQKEGLQAVFHDQDLSVRADVEVSRGKVSVSLVTLQTRNGVQVEGPSLDGFGGAVSTVQSILLRLAIIFRRGLKPILILDETLPAFDGRYVHSMGEFLKVLCHRLNVDILLITHNPALVEAADRAYRIVPTKGSASTFHQIR